MHIVIFVTAKNSGEANEIAKKLVSEKLVACANVVKDIKSSFWWHGKVYRDDEVLLILKTRKALFNKITKAIKSIHSYSVPEIIAMPIVAGNKAYLKWIDESTTAK